MMTVTVYFLSQYPAVLNRLRKEILEKVGSNRRPTYDDIREMKYLRAVLNGVFDLVPRGDASTDHYQNQCVCIPLCEPRRSAVVSLKC